MTTTDLPFDAVLDEAQSPADTVLAGLRAEIAARAAAGTTLDQFVALTHLKRELDAALADVKKALAPRAAEMVADLQAAGTDGVRHSASGAMVSIGRKIWARATTSKPDACAALKAAGLGDYVEEGFNTNSLSAYFRETYKTEAAARREAGNLAPITMDDLLPASLADHVALTEDFTLGCSK